VPDGLRTHSVSLQLGHEPLYTELLAQTLVRPKNMPVYLENEAIKWAFCSYRSVPAEDCKKPQVREWR
jgi:hypothetical protein